MAARDEGLSLSQRQEVRYKMFDKQLEDLLQKYLLEVKQIEKEWDIFKEQNPKVWKLYSKLQEVRSRDKNYQFTIDEAAYWRLVSEKIEAKGEKIVRASEQHKKKHKSILNEKSQFYASCVKKWQNKVQSKGLYDTDSEEEVEVNQGLHLTKEERSRLKEESQYLTEQIIALGGLHSDYIRARGNLQKGAYDYAILDR